MLADFAFVLGTEEQHERSGASVLQGLVTLHPCDPRCLLAAGKLPEFMAREVVTGPSEFPGQTPDFAVRHFLFRC